MTNSGKGGGFGGFPDDPRSGPANLVDDNPLLKLDQSANASRGPTRAPAANTAATLGLISLVFWCMGPFGILAGVLALEEVKRSRGKLRGNGSAMFGLLGGIVGTVALLTVLVAYVVWRPSLGPWLQSLFNDDATPTLERATPTAADPQQNLSDLQLKEIDPVEAKYTVHGKEQGMPVVQIYGNLPEGSGLDLVLHCAGAIGGMQARALVRNSSAEFGPMLHDGARLSDGECTGWVRLDPEHQPSNVKARFGVRGSKLQGSNVRVEGGTRVWQIPVDFRIGDGSETAEEANERGTLKTHYEVFATLRDDLRRKVKAMDKGRVDGNDERWVSYSAYWNDRRLTAIDSFQQVFGYTEKEYGGTQPRAWNAVRTLPDLVYREWEAVDAELSGIKYQENSAQAKANTDRGFREAKTALHLE